MRGVSTKSKAYLAKMCKSFIYRILLYKAAVRSTPLYGSCCPPPPVSEAVTKALYSRFEFERDVIPQEFRLPRVVGKREKSRVCILTKQGAGQRVIESKVGSTGEVTEFRSI